MLHHLHAGVKLYTGALAGGGHSIPQRFLSSCPNLRQPRFALDLESATSRFRLSGLGLGPAAFDPRPSSVCFRSSALDLGSPWTFFCPMTPDCIWVLLHFRPKTQNYE